MTAPAPDPDGDKRWNDTFHQPDEDLAALAESPAELEASQAAIDRATLVRLLGSVDDPTCYVPFCGAATYAALCIDKNLHVVYACDNHQFDVAGLRRVRCPGCGKKGRPVDLLRWRIVFARRSRP
jgi:hypothetical protein